MRGLRILPCISLLLLAACGHYIWTPEQVNGLPLSQAQEECRAQAEVYVEKHRPFGEWYEPGPADFPLDSPRDLENREIERCLTAKGFHRTRLD